MNRKILVSDYDKTFYLNDKDIEKNKIAVNEFRKNGNIFVIATGRSYIDFNSVVNDYNFNYDYVILNHGATIINKNNDVYYNFIIDNEIVNTISNDLELEKANKIVCFSNLKKVKLNHKNLTKINIKYNDNEDSIRINRIIKDKYSNFVTSYYVADKTIEIISNKTNKSKAINLLLDKLNISNNNIYTIGDGYSDIDMIKDYNGYAMKDSVKELKNVAKKQYDSVSDLIYEIME